MMPAKVSSPVRDRVRAFSALPQWNRRSIDVVDPAHIENQFPRGMFARYQKGMLLSTIAITIAANHDTEGRLILIGGRLAGVLVHVDNALDEANYNRWFLEIGFGKLANATGATFDTLDAATEQVERLFQAG